MTGQVEVEDRNGYRDRQRTAIWLALWLAALTAVEFLIAVNVESPLLWLLPFVAAKGWLILRYFMHVRDVLRRSTDGL